MKFKNLIVYLCFLLSAGISYGTETIDLEKMKGDDRYYRGSCPGDYINLKGITLFLADDGTHGRELWRTDGTTSGTYLVKDIFSGEKSSEIKMMGVMNETLFFSADDGVHGKDVWRSDGTRDGTFILKDIEPDVLMKKAYNVAMNDDIFYFSATKENNNHSLWISDGTKNGTRMVRDGLNSPSGIALVITDDCVFFESKGRLWKSNGTKEETVEVLSPQSDISLEYHPYMVSMNETLYFLGNNSKNGLSLYKSDGTNEGTVIIREIGDKSAYGSFLSIANNLLFFGANRGNKAFLWRSDGTSEGTIVLKEVKKYYQLTEFNGHAYFFGYDTVNGVALWKSDGTIAGTHVLKVLKSGKERANQYNLIQLGKHLYYFFSINSKYQVFRTDGTEKGTVPVKEIDNRYRIHNMFSANTKMFLSKEDWTHGAELWKVDSSLKNLEMVKDIKPDSIGSTPEFLYQDDQIVFFSAKDGLHGKELWKSDGTIKGTHLLKDINPGVDDSHFQIISFHNGVLYFTANNTLWKSDGTAKGTVRIDIARAYQCDSLKLFPFYFNGYDDQNGWELWRSDGTIKGSYMIKDINKEKEQVGNHGVAFHKNFYYFTTGSHSDVPALWRTDGTEKGTQLVNDFKSFDKESYFSSFTMVGDNLFFVHAIFDENLSGDFQTLMRVDTVTGELHFVKKLCRWCYTDEPQNIFSLNGFLLYEMESEGIWRSDGTEKGTKKFLDGWEDLTPTKLNEELFFFRRNEKWEEELWRSNGTQKGTVVIANLVKDKPTKNGFPSNLFTLNGKTHFVWKRYDVNKKSSLLELWQMNETLDKAVPLFSFPVKGHVDALQMFVVSNNTLYFMSNSSSNHSSCTGGSCSSDLWKSDGTLKGTEKISTFRIRDSSFNFNTIRGVNGNIIIRMVHPEYGDELWRSDGTPEGTYQMTGENLNANN